MKRAISVLLLLALTLGLCACVGSAAELDAETRNRISGIIARYLAHTGLLYRGIGVAPSCGLSRFPSSSQA